MDGRKDEHVVRKANDSYGSGSRQRRDNSNRDDADDDDRQFSTGPIPGTTNLMSFLDCRLVVALRDGRKFFGVLRSFDQFGNLLMTDTYERYYVDLEYAEEYRGVYLIRGENVVMVGELDEEEFQTISRRMAKFKRPLDVILPKFHAMSRHSADMRLRLDQLGLSELMEQDNY